MIFRKSRKVPVSEQKQSIELETENGPLTVRVRVDQRAKRYLLRLPADNSGPILTLPKNGSLKRAEKFAQDHVAWLVSRMTRRPESVSMNAGDRIPLRGQDHLIVATGKLRGLVRQEIVDGQALLYVPGEEGHIARKLTAWLRQQARDDLQKACQHHSAKLGRPYKSITIRDTKSRWGSCSSEGSLSFSWRLVLAPPEILDYVAAHEVAHLKEMNHSQAFWRLCEALAPQTTTARAWLKENGVRLHSFG